MSITNSLHISNIRAAISHVPPIRHLQRKWAGSDISALLPCAIQGHATAQQLEDLRTLLRTMAADPAGKVLLNALRNHIDSSGLNPTLVLDSKSAAGTAVDSDSFTWHVDLQQLQQGPIEEARCQLADLFKSISDPQREHVYTQQLRPRELTDKEIQQREKYIAQDSRGEQRATALERIDAWVVEARRNGGISHEQMQDMLRLIENKSKIPRYDFELDLAGLNLSSLPKIPKGVTALNLSDNRIRSATFPKTLHTLRLNANAIGIKDAFFLLWNLPSSVKQLELDDNRIGLMLAIPYHLEYCSLSGNGLLLLPHVPSGLRELQVAHNNLNVLPHLKTAWNLEVLDLRDNRFHKYPETLNELKPTCIVDLRWNDVSRFHLPPGSPRVAFSTPNDTAEQLSASPYSLSSEIREWIANADEATLTQWRKIAHEPNARAFYDFLQRLHLSDSYEIEAFRANIADWLTELARPDRAELRERSFTVCKGAADSCGDRAGLCLTDLNIVRVEDQIRRGVYDGRTKDLLQVARQVYRLKVLTELAIKHVQEKQSRDPIEVHLGYQVKTREALELSLVLPKMNHPDPEDSITANQAARAIEHIKTREPMEFLDFLCQDYDGWQYELQRNFAVPYQEAQEKRLALFEAQFESMLDQKLQEIGVEPDDEDARREAGVAVARELNGQVMKEVSMAYLKSLGLVGFSQ